MNQIEQQVIELLAEVRYYPKEKIGMNTSIIDDLGVAGDDADELFLAFDKKFGTDSRNLDFKRFFGNEGMYPWELPLLVLKLLWGLVRLLNGKTFIVRRKPADDMKVSDFVEAAVSKKWNNRFEPASCHNGR